MVHAGHTAPSLQTTELPQLTVNAAAVTSMQAGAAWMPTRIHHAPGTTPKRALDGHAIHASPSPAAKRYKTGEAPDDTASLGQPASLPAPAASDEHVEAYNLISDDEEDDVRPYPAAPGPPCPVDVQAAYPVHPIKNEQLSQRNLLSKQASRDPRIPLRMSDAGNASVPHPNGSFMPGQDAAAGLAPAAGPDSALAQSPVPGNGDSPAVVQLSKKPPSGKASFGIRELLQLTNDQQQWNDLPARPRSAGGSRRAGFERGGSQDVGDALAGGSAHHPPRAQSLPAAQAAAQAAPAEEAKLEPDLAMVPADAAEPEIDENHVKKIIRDCFPDGMPLEVLGSKLAPSAARCFRDLLNSAKQKLKEGKPPTAANRQEQLLNHVCVMAGTVQKELREHNTKLSHMDGDPYSLPEVRSLEEDIVRMLVSKASKAMKKGIDKITALDVLNNLPTVVASDSAFGEYKVPSTDPRVGLRGESGVKTLRDVACNSLMGHYSGFQMFALEFRHFSKHPPARLLQNMAELLQDKFRPNQQVTLPGPLAPYLAELYYIEESMGEHIVKCMLKTCTLQQQQQPVQPAGKGNGGGGNGRGKGNAKGKGNGKAATFAAAAVAAVAGAQAGAAAVATQGKSNGKGKGKAAGTATADAGADAGAGDGTRDGELGGNGKKNAKAKAAALAAAAVAAAAIAVEDSADAHVKSPEKERTGADKGGAADAPEMVWVASASDLEGVLRECMMEQLRKGIKNLGMDIPLQHQDDPDVIEKWLEAEDAVWAFTCECYGADIETQGTLGRTGKESLASILTNLGDDDVRTQLVGKLVLNSSLTTTAIPQQRNLMARINDPAVDLPGLKDVPGNVKEVKYQQQSMNSNCYQVVVQIAGWPLLFLVTSRRIQKDMQASYSYGVHYWTNLFDHKRAMDKAKSHLVERLENKSLKHLLRVRDLGLAGGPAASTNLHSGALSAASGEALASRTQGVLHPAAGQAHAGMGAAALEPILALPGVDSGAGDGDGLVEDSAETMSELRPQPFGEAARVSFQRPASASLPPPAPRTTGARPLYQPAPHPQQLLGRTGLLHQVPSAPLPSRAVDGQPGMAGASSAPMPSSSAQQQQQQPQTASGGSMPSGQPSSSGIEWAAPRAHDWSKDARPTPSQMLGLVPFQSADSFKSHAALPIPQFNFQSALAQRRSSGGGLGLPGGVETLRPNTGSMQQGSMPAANTVPIRSMGPQNSSYATGPPFPQAFVRPQPVSSAHPHWANGMSKMSFTPTSYRPPAQPLPALHHSMGQAAPASYHPVSRPAFGTAAIEQRNPMSHPHELPPAPAAFSTAGQLTNASLQALAPGQAAGASGLPAGQPAWDPFPSAVAPTPAFQPFVSQPALAPSLAAPAPFLPVAQAAPEPFIIVELD